MPNLAEPTPDEIRSFREAHALSQVALGEALGSSGRTVEDWEAGRRKPPAMLRLALAAIAAKLDPAPDAVQRRAEVEERISQSIDRMANLASVTIAEQSDDERFDWAQTMAVDAALVASDWALLRSAPVGGFQAPGLFEIYRDKAGNWRARYMLSRQAVFTTAAYALHSEAMTAVGDIQKYATLAPVVTDGPLGRSAHYFLMYQDNIGAWRAEFRYKTETIFVTEGYKSSLDLSGLIYHIQTNLAPTIRQGASRD